MNWIYENKEIHSITDLPFELPFGFVYKITNVTLNKIYVGKKNFYSVTTKALGKKELALITDKRKSKFKTVIKESDWLNYNSSCKPLLEDLTTKELGKKEFAYEWRKEIIEITEKKGNLTYLEMKHQILNDVLEVESYNENILGSFYKGKV